MPRAQTLSAAALAERAWNCATSGLGRASPRQCGRSAAGRTRLRACGARCGGVAAGRVVRRGARRRATSGQSMQSAAPAALVRAGGGTRGDRARAQCWSAARGRGERCGVIAPNRARDWPGLDRTATQCIGAHGQQRKASDAAQPLCRAYLRVEAGVRACAGEPQRCSSRFAFASLPHTQERLLGQRAATCSLSLAGLLDLCDGARAATCAARCTGDGQSDANRPCAEGRLATSARPLSAPASQRLLRCPRTPSGSRSTALFPVRAGLLADLQILRASERCAAQLAHSEMHSCV